MIKKREYCDDFTIELLPISLPKSGAAVLLSKIKKKKRKKSRAYSITTISVYVSLRFFCLD